MPAAPFTQERFFVTTARQQLAVLQAYMDSEDIAIPAIDAGVENHVLDKYLKATALIKSTALPVSARAVYRAAQAVEKTLIQKKQNPNITNFHDDYHTRLAALRSLIGLYSEGLFELDPEFKNEINNENKHYENKQATIALDLEITTTEVPANLANNANINEDESSIEQIKQTLKPLIIYSENTNQEKALSSLMAYKPALITENPSNTVLTKSSKPTNISAINNREIANKQTARSFDDIMRAITGRVLAEARGHGKDISISYHAEFDEIDVPIADTIQALLLACLLSIVKAPSMDSNYHGNTRCKSAADKSKSQHIVISGLVKTSQKIIEINWDGNQFNRNHRFNHSLSKFEKGGGVLDISDYQNGQIRFICPSQTQLEPVKKLAKEA